MDVFMSFVDNITDVDYKELVTVNDQVQTATQSTFTTTLLPVDQT